MPWSHWRQIRHLSAVVVRVINEWAPAGFGLPDDGPRSQRPGHSLPGGGRALCKSNEGRPAQLLCCPILDSGLGRLAACYACLISAGGALIIVVGSGAMAESDTIAVWVVDDTEHQVLDEFVSTREAVEQRIEEIVALCAYEPRWTMDVIRINGSPLRLIGVAIQKS